VSRTYRGFRIKKYEGVWVGYKTDRGTSARAGLGTSRKYVGWQLFYPDSDASKIVDTLAEAYAYINSYLS
jgi:hypothetical protein